MNQNLNDLSVVEISETPAHPIVNTTEMVGFSIPGTGNGTRVCFVDSGVPDHEAIVNIGGHINFTADQTFRDFVGHSTVLAGLVGGNKPDHIQGVAPDAILFFAKATNDKGEAAFDATTASVLWAIVKEVNVVVLPLVINAFNLGLQEAIKKAHAANICIIMAANNDVKYEHAMYVSPINDEEGCGTRFKDPLNVVAPAKGFYTTHLEQTYAKASGLAISTALIGGVCTLAVEQLKKQKKPPTPGAVYQMLAESLIKKEEPTC
jgi:hypothetical protein